MSLEMLLQISLNIICCIALNITCNIITARKRSLEQGNVFTPVCHSVHKGGGWLPSMHYRSHDQGVCIQGVGQTPPPCMGYCRIRSTSGRYASYWNAFLLAMLITISLEMAFEKSLPMSLKYLYVSFEMSLKSSFILKQKGKQRRLDLIAVSPSCVFKLEWFLSES